MEQTLKQKLEAALEKTDYSTRFDKEFMALHTSPELEEARKVKQAAEIRLQKLQSVLEVEAFKVRDEVVSLILEGENSDNEDERDLAEELSDGLYELMNELCDNIWPGTNMVYNQCGYHSHSDIDSFWEPSTC